MASGTSTRIWLRRAAGGALVIATPACTQLSPVSSAAPPGPVAAGMARLWFYRDYEPSVSLNMAPMSLNGAPVGYVPADGSAFYRDVAAGHYHIAAQSEGMDVNQTKDVDLAPGQEAFVKVLSSSSWESGGDFLAYHRDTFYVSVVPPQIARADVATRPLTGG